jgi:hypothetical protein
MPELVGVAVPPNGVPRPAIAPTSGSRLVTMTPSLQALTRR